MTKVPKKCFEMSKISSNWCQLTDLDEIGHLYWPEFFWRNFYSSYLQFSLEKIHAQYTQISMTP